MKQRELDAIRERERLASMGPWLWRSGPEEEVLPELVGPMGQVLDFGDTTDFYPTEGEPPNSDDSFFIAKSREDIPALLAEIDRLREGLDEISYAFWSEDITQQEVIHEINKMVIALVIGEEGENEK